MGATRFLARGGVSLAVGVIAVLTVLFVLVQSAGAQTAGIISFGTSALKNEISANPTSLQFGPDGRLYVAQQDGTINAYTIKRNGPNDYAVTATETITLIKQIPNHNDNGALAASQHQGKRQVTGIVVTGTAAKPVIYVGSSDYRIGAGGNATDLNLDTNSGIISRLDWDGSKWVKTDLVRGLPRSEENHSINGLQLSSDGTTLYVAVGGNTNKGAPSNNFAFLPEYALSTAILSVDLTKIGNSTYDLPTLDDETRSGTTDANDPFGGNDGKNQAKLVADGPVQIYSPGYRNAYDLVITESGKMYTIDNGGNEGWGDVPENEGPAGVCTNKVMEPGTTDKDSLHYVVHQNYYGGHPNPTRGNKANTFNDTNPQSPVHAANAIECDYRDNTAEGGDKGELTTFGASTNGIAEYTASNFSGAMKGNLLAASFSGQIFRLVLNGSGTALTKKEALFSNFGSQPLDVTAQGDDDKFPGTVWAAVYGANAVQVFEPADYDGTGTQCTGADDPSLDEDGDGFKNADEIDNNTDPCSAASVPADWDGDKISNKNDPDDDNDGIPDASDEFAIDANNGKKTDLPVSYTWDNDAPRPGGLLSLGFTGLMTNGADNYESLFDPENMTAGGAAGVTTIDKVPAGDAKGSANTQKYGFQFGVNATSTSGVFTAHTRILAPFAGLTPQGNQSMGLFLGNGDQDNYVKLVTSSKGIEFAKETGGTYAGRTPASVTMPGPDYVDLYLTVDPAAGTVQPSYTVTANGNTGPRTNLGGTETVPAGWFGNATNGLAVGIISTSAGGSEFPATWDFIQVVKGQGGDPVSASELAAEPADVKFGNVLVGQEKSANVKLTNKGTQESLTIKSAEITPASTGTTAEGFSTSLGSQVTLKPGESITLAVKFKPQSAGSQAGTLAITHTGTNSPLGIPLSGFGAPGAPYRVNAGAGNLAGPPEWSADTLASPSPYVNAAETGNKTYINGAATIDTSDPSVPPGTPPALFKSERWDPPEGPEMSWKFPVEPGKYKVRLYFAEIYSGAYKEGARVFDVLVEGQTVLDNYDVYKEAGGGEKGIVETFEATSDDVLNIDFAHGPANNPAIKGIEILPVSTGPGSTAEAQLTISPFNTDIDASTYENGSFKITNNSTNGEKITSLKLDLSTAILPDVVFDPDGTGGDTVFKCFKADSGASTVGLVTDGSGSGDGSCKTPFSQPHEGGGYDVLEIKFNDFGPGETFTFSADLDPTSIKGTGSPGPGKSGSISGLELTGATATTSFDDGSTHVAEPYRKPATLHASQNVIKANPPAKPGVTVPGVTLQPTTLSAQHFAATVNKAEQTVRVGGPAGASVQLMIMEGGLFINNNPYEREPYEANSAVAVSEKSATIGTSGTVDIPVTLTRKEGTTAKDIGLNHIVAVIKDAKGRTGSVSDVAILKYDPNYQEPGGQAPVIEPISDQSAVESEPFSLQVKASDADGDTLSYAAQGLPAGLSIDAKSGLISGVVSPGASANSPYNVTVTVSDGAKTDSKTFKITVSKPAGAGGAAALFKIDPGTAINATTHTAGSIKITNNSTNGEKITSLKLDLSTAILPDMVFDPVGKGGDTTGKCLTADSGATATGYVKPQDPCTDPFSQPHDGGYDVMEIKFNGFDPGETFTFSVDIDPTSIKGSTNQGQQGSVSGLELTGSTATVGFGTAGSEQAETYRIPASEGGSQNTVKANPPAKPGVTVPGVTLQPTTLSAQHFAATVNKAEQTVRVGGPAGASVALLVLEGRTQTGNLAGGGYDVEPYEANTVDKVAEYQAQIGANGTVDIPVTLLRTYSAGGLNHIVAVVKDAAGRTGPNSDVAILKYDPNYKGSQKILNPQPSTVSFGQVEVGNEKSQQISLFNTGDAEMTVQSAETSGADADQFVATLGGPTKVAPGESITLPVKFAPTSAGSKAAKLTLGHDGQNSPLEVQLSGTGVEPAPSDTVAPDTRILSGPSRFVKSRTARLAFESTEANSRFQCRLDGGSYASCSVPKVYRNLSDGRHVFRVRAIDSAGNVDGTPAVRRWTVDNSGPTVNPLSPRPGAKLTTRRPTVKAIVRDEYTNLGGGAIKLYVDGKQVRLAYDKKTDRLVYRSKKLSLGKHTVKVVANDAAKNRTTRTWSFKVVKR